MLAKSLIFATLAALAIAAPTPAPYGRHRQGSHRNHQWGNHGSKWNSNNNNNGSGSSDSSSSDSSNDWSPSTSDSGNSSNDSSSNDWSQSQTTTSADAQSTSSGSSGQVDSGSAVSGGFSAIASYYDITNPSENEGQSSGSVACSGAKYANTDAIVAIASQQYNGGAVCGKRVRITDTKTGNTAEATIVDECMSCSDNQLDLTPSLWSQLHGQSTDNNNNDGVFDIKWEYI
ncbi:hypothetical protein CC85DRAFT_284911 [Cutaneotrichosporon oleaginosum]|uniref:Barwin domain-containing protein n=1 Tax=Cutaneotrichosporon oleaginosum TaxID=879819 RepID=A0A0J0XPW4_9TREE|nr:uncharacterized protein CC85DRAFT_284911 [Cutaneotrichosporon oleaginosum]KLT43155.1 hypothetical protein CC85DRAFT_284911 [Cutaneotrichosporon oleaginosum]TXT10081.1 hypothetical protein COLE_04015 [Cutaneotrichosporon oleaginosum]